MRFVYSEIYQGSIAAAHVEVSTQELVQGGEQAMNPEVLSPVVIDQAGEIVFLAPAGTVAAAIATAKAYIEQNNRRYIDHVLQSNVPPENAIQHFQDCGIPLELIPPLVVERPYYPPCLPALSQDALAFVRQDILPGSPLSLPPCPT